MIKEIFESFEKKTKQKLLIFYFLTLIFVFVEVFLIASLYPIFQNFFSEDQNQNFISKILNFFFVLRSDKSKITLPSTRKNFSTFVL